MTNLLNCRGYSAHEHTTLFSNVAHSSTVASSNNPLGLLPPDVTIEALVSVVLVSVGLVLGTEKLQPITHSAWAGQIEREGGARNPYKNLDERAGFWDVRVSIFLSSLCWIFGKKANVCV